MTRICNKKKQSTSYQKAFQSLPWQNNFQNMSWRNTFQSMSYQSLFKAYHVNHFSMHVISKHFFKACHDKHFLEHFMSNPFQASYPARWSSSLLLCFQLCHDKALFKGCHVKTCQKGQSLTCRPSSRDRTDGGDLRLCLLLESAKASTMALTVVTKRITPSVMFIDLGFAFIYLKTNPVIRSKIPKR